MKSFKSLCLIILLFLIGIPYVNAAGASLSVSSGTIENGNSVTASVSVNAAAWNVTITSTGVTSGCTKSFADASSDGGNTNKTFSVTCKSTSTGIINFVLSGDVTGSDGNTVRVSGSRQVSVVKPREKSSNNKLKSLGVEGYELSPAFSNDVHEYSVTVPSTVEKVNITATKADGYASLSGTGEKEVEEGVNNFEVVVTSETGVSNTYKIIVNVEDINPIEVDVNGKKYTVVKVAKNLEKPELFEETTVKIGDIEIPAFKNDIAKYTLVGLKNEEGKISLFIYNNGEYIEYNEFKSDGIYLIYLDMPKVPTNYIKTKVKIGGEDRVAYKLKGDNKYLVYGLNLSTGKKNYYTYDSSEKTLQRFDYDKYQKKIKEEQDNEYILYGLSGGVLFLFILLVLTTSKSRKLKKLVKMEKSILDSMDISSTSNTSTKYKEKEKNQDENYIDDDFLDLDTKKRKKNAKKSKTFYEVVKEELDESNSDEEIEEEKPKRGRKSKKK